MDAFILLLLLLFFFAGIQFFRDSCSADPVRQNYPVIYAVALQLRKAAPFLRRYVHGNDSQNPLGPDEVRYIHQASQGKPDQQAFGLPHTNKQTRIRINHAFLPFPAEHMHSQPLLIGKQSRFPYLATRRLYISGMGAGALSRGANLALAHGARKSNILFNNGEAGLLPGCLDSQADIMFQIGVAGFLCKDIHGQYSEKLFQWLGSLSQIKMFEIKISQGAKPGVAGGAVPAFAVTPELALSRGIMPFTKFSTPSAFSFQSERDLLAMIATIKRCTGKPAGFKICFSTISQFESVCSLMAERKMAGHLAELPDFISIDGADGGTTGGDAYMMRAVGAPLQESLPQLDALLKRYHLRDDVLIFASGQLSVPEKAAWAFAAGADMIGISRGFMIAMGCIQAQKCDTNKCPSGIATRDHSWRPNKKSNLPQLKSESVALYAHTLEQDLLKIAKVCGVPCYSSLTPHHVQVVEPPNFRTEIPFRYTSAS